MTLPAAFLFDMDGLLLDSERVARDAFVEMADRTAGGLADAEAFFLTMVGTSAETTRRMVQRYVPDGHDVNAFLDGWGASFRARMMTGIPLKPHVRGVLETLHADGHRMAVVTSTAGKAARAHLDHANLLHFFERVTGGDEVSANKPDPTPYLETATALGVAARDCAAFEDSDRGIAAAVKAGCRSVQVPDLRAADVPLPDLGQHVATDLRQAMHILNVF